MTSPNASVTTVSALAGLIPQSVAASVGSFAKVYALFAKARPTLNYPMSAQKAALLGSLEFLAD